MVSAKNIGRCLGVFLGILLLGGIAATQSSTSTKGGGFSTKAIQALENCFDSMGNFTCSGSGTVGPGTTDTLTKFTGATTVGDSQITDDGTDVVATVAGNFQVLAGGSEIALQSDGEVQFASDVDGGTGGQWAIVFIPAGSSGDIVLESAELAGMNGGDTVNLYNINFTNADHTGAGNLLVGTRHATILAPDAQAVAVSNYVGSGWDSFLTAEVDTDGWSADDDPPTNTVALYADESGANCNLNARLADGSEIVVAVLVVAGNCP